MFQIHNNFQFSSPPGISPTCMYFLNQLLLLFIVKVHIPGKNIEFPVKLLEKEANMRINSLVILLQLSCSKGLKNMSHQLPNATPVAMRIKQKQYFRKFKINCCEQVSAMDRIGFKLITKERAWGCLLLSNWQHVSS